MTISASELRQNIYRLLDHVAETGEPLEIERKGRRLRIVAVDRGSKLSRIKGDPDAIVGDPADLVHMDWSGYWEP
jgi:antitoxin (DNA-binding transcriptional repressor) of toxin-antitoxin stability system